MARVWRCRSDNRDGIVSRRCALGAPALREFARGCRSLPAVNVGRNRARVLELVDRVINGHDPEAVKEFTSNPAVIGSASGLLTGFPDLAVTIKWIVAEGDMVVFFFELRGTHRGPLFLVQQPTGNRVETSFLLAFRFDEDGQILDQWLGSNFVDMLAQLGWGFAPVGEIVQVPR
jgi:predicted ester cyclase